MMKHENPSYKHNGFVYLLKTESIEYDVLYKIGVTKGKVMDRVKKMLTGNPNGIELIGYYSTEISPFTLEKTLHGRYSAFRVNGEWFNLEYNEVLNFIDNCKHFESNLKLCGFK